MTDDELMDPRFVICPHCDHHHEDSWEFFMNSEYRDEIECYNCEKTFEARCVESVTYYSRAIPGEMP